MKKRYKQREVGGLPILGINKLLHDNPQGMTAKQIINSLESQFGISLTRTTVYRHIDLITRFENVQIYKTRNGAYLYRIEEIK